MKTFLPMNLQMFADPAADPTGEGAQQPSGQQAAPEFDYEKLASIVSGKQTVAEDTVLKSYFKQQGMSKEEMDQAINTFKEQKAATTPDVSVLQAQAQQAQQIAIKAQMDAKAQMAAIQLGVDAKVLPYVLKLADLSNLTIESKDEDFTAALNKVLEDIPAFKKDVTATTGFQQVGSSGQSQAQTATDDQLDRIFGNNKK